MQFISACTVYLYLISLLFNLSSVSFIFLGKPFQPVANIIFFGDTTVAPILDEGSRDQEETSLATPKNLKCQYKLFDMFKVSFVEV